MTHVKSSVGMPATTRSGAPSLDAARWQARQPRDRGVPPAVVIILGRSGSGRDGLVDHVLVHRRERADRRPSWWQRKLEPELSRPAGVWGDARAFEANPDDFSRANGSRASGEISGPRERFDLGWRAGERTRLARPVSGVGLEGASRASEATGRAIRRLSGRRRRRMPDVVVRAPMNGASRPTVRSFARRGCGSTERVSRARDDRAAGRARKADDLVWGRVGERSCGDRVPRPGNVDQRPVRQLGVQ